MRGRSNYERCCEILEVPPGTPMPEIERSFRELIKVWHPDRFADNPALQMRATQKTSEITKSFQWIRKHASTIKEPEARSTTTPERILNNLRHSLTQYLENHPGTSDVMIERAVRTLLLEVKPVKKQERVYPFRFLTNWSFGRAGNFIVARRKQILFWTVAFVLFLLFGAR
ncbi:J domain-containing protein [bacterium]|nr:J domain-containing protein [bacterium]